MIGKQRLALVLGGAMAVRAIRARRSAGPTTDPCGPDGLRLPEGRRTTVTTDDQATLAVLVAGPEDGPTIVLGHCWMGGMHLWGAVARQLVADGNRVVLWDQRGHGDSTLGTDPVTVDRLGADLAAILDALDLHDLVLAGHSMGGMTVQAYATNHAAHFRDRVRAVALVATSAHSGVLKVSPRIADALLGDGRTAALAKREPKAMGRYGHIDSARAMHEAMLTATGTARAGFLVAMGRMDYRPGLRNIGVPTKIVVGTRDPLTPPVRARELLAGIPDSELRVLKGYGHMLPFEAPDVVADTIRALVIRELAPTS